MARSTEWIRTVPAPAVAELDAALRGLERRGLGWPAFGRDDFPLPTFSRELAAVLDELERGRGFVLLRGIPVDRYTPDELKNLYWGLGAHLGHARWQNSRGELIGEVRDENRLYGEVREPSMDPTLGRSSRSKARSSGPLRFHTDRCDVVTLLCVRRARAGGLSRIVSAVSVANAILARRPDLHALCGGTTGEAARAGGRRAQNHAMPPLWRCTRASSPRGTRGLRGGCASPGIPRLTAAQDEALDLHAEARGLALHDGTGARRSPAPQQSRRLSRAHRIRDADGRP
jgi:hypothetical protein